MVQFHVDSDDLAVKSLAVRSSIGQIRSEVAAMQNNLAELQDTWTGSASAGFQALMADWRATQLRVEESLEGINTALSSAAMAYADAEERNTRLFTA
ncbi:MAG: WXG100 family type VII secretion target [Actinomycetales bacterium]|jgi:WXG100 family type VII secretion target